MDKNRIKGVVKNRDDKPPAQKRKANKQPRPGEHSVKDNRLELLFTIVNRQKAEYYLDLLQSFEINMQLIALGHGTADARTLAYFGLESTDKAILMGVVQEKLLPDVLAALDEKFHTIRNGKGIAYTVPLTGVIGTLIFGFLSNNRLTVKTDNREDK